MGRQIRQETFINRMRKPIVLCPCGQRHPHFRPQDLRSMSRKELEDGLKELLSSDDLHLAQISKLRGAIRQHRLEVWGEYDPIDHPQDLELYTVLLDDEYEARYKRSA